MVKVQQLANNITEWTSISLYKNVLRINYALNNTYHTVLMLLIIEYCGSYSINMFCLEGHSNQNLQENNFVLK